MVITTPFKVYTGTTAGTEAPSAETDAANINLLNDDSYDSAGTAYATKQITIPPSGTSYSYERWTRVKFNGTFNMIENIKAFIQSWTASTGVTLYGGTSVSGVTPVVTQSSVATTINTSWDAVGEAIDITPSGGISSAGGYSKYLVLQLRVADTAAIGDINTFTIEVDYDAS